MKYIYSKYLFILFIVFNLSCKKDRGGNLFEVALFDENYIGNWYCTDDDCGQYIKIDSLSNGKYGIRDISDNCTRGINGGHYRCAENTYPKVMVNSHELRVSCKSFIIEEPPTIREKIINDTLKTYYYMVLSIRRNLYDEESTFCKGLYNFDE
ncbi:MAG: hypothetical protein A2033_00585 [Bacteroidetes bacterium GWA2_31_9]|nr:MAG: hypothetical protein A2033_00585 [Bacteroidetes bacterium GWA2_31_9]